MLETAPAPTSPKRGWIQNTPFLGSMESSHFLFDDNGSKWLPQHNLQATKEAYEKAYTEWEAARFEAEAKALWDLEHPPTPRRPPNDLDEAIDFGVRDRVEEVLKLMQEEYDQRGTYMMERVQHLEDETNKKK